MASANSRSHFQHYQTIRILKDFVEGASLIFRRKSGGRFNKITFHVQLRFMRRFMFPRRLRAKRFLNDVRTFIKGPTAAKWE